MNRNRKLRKGVSYMEMLVSVVLLGIVAGVGIAGWNFSIRASATKRRTEMAVFIGVQELERMKAKKYLNMSSTVNVQYYDKNGAPVSSASTGGYKAKSWASTLINRDSTSNTEDLLELRVEIWDNTETTRLENIQTLLTYGGL